MEKLSMDLPPGFRFSPTDKELIELFLKPKITRNDEDIYFVPEVEFYKLEPWDLQYKSGIDTKDQEWFFFAAQGLQHQKGKGRNRKTEKGYWKVTGNDRKIKSEGTVIGMKKTLVFHIGRSRKGTKWVMHEYRTTLKDLDGTHPGQPAPNISESWGLTLGNRGDCLHNKSSSSQNNIVFDNETLINMVSAKDNLADANARIELEHQDLVWLDEIINPEVSLGLLKSASYIESVERSSDQIIGSN
ncbi:protein ntm1-like 9 [Quercus suber]|uniref:Protein ntm1-like 9 n=1 Tax=Quercus suber TaxID=58331 RepID=A0AAW0LYU0_QUESU